MTLETLEEEKGDLQSELEQLRGELRLRDAEISHLKSKMGKKKYRTGSMDHYGIQALDLSGGNISPIPSSRSDNSLGSSDEQERARSERPAGLIRRERNKDLKKKGSLGNMVLHRAMRGSLAVFDNTLHVGKKAGKAVIKGSVKTGKGFGMIFKSKNERQKRLSNARTTSKAKTKWDHAVDLIDDLIYDDASKLTEDQKNGLKDVQELLLGGGWKGSVVENSYHIPLDLLEESSGESSRVTMVSKSYVLKEYGGITSRQQRPGILRQSGIRASTVAKGMMSFEDWDDSIPSEFQTLTHDQRCEVAKMLKWSVLKNWDYDIFKLNELSMGHPLVMIGWAILGAPHSQHAMAKYCNNLETCEEEEFIEGYNFVESDLKLPLDKLCPYLRLIEDNYRKGNPYHNAIHAADVVQTLHSLIVMAGDELKTTDEEIFSALLASVVHDVDHPGLNNGYQVNARTNLSLAYNDISVLENHHASKAFTMMLKSTPFGQIQPPKLGRVECENINRECDFNILCNLKPEAFAEIKSKTIDAILHTDMKLHFKTVSKIKGLIMSEDPKEEEDTAWQILIFMLHMADISNAGKPGVTSRKWTDRCLEEFFNQGDQEKMLGMEPSPQCDRDKTSKPGSQIGFIQFVVLPAFEVLACIIPELREVVIPHLEHNKQFWEVESLMVEEEEEGDEDDSD